MPRTWARWFGGVLPVVAGLLLVLVTGLVHGLWSNRWSGEADLEAASARLTRAPLHVAGWKGQDESPLDARRLARAGAAGHLRRLYVNEQKQTVSVTLLCGRFGPLSVHTPDVCYGGAGYEMLGSPVRRQIRLAGGGSAEVWTARFHKPSAPGEAPLRICWSWSAGAGWKAPDSPRWAFRMRPVLFKLYVAREMTRLEEPLDSDPSLAFLSEWLPELDRCLFGKRLGIGEKTMNGLAQGWDPGITFIQSSPLRSRKKGSRQASAG